MRRFSLIDFALGAIVVVPLFGPSTAYAVTEILQTFVLSTAPSTNTACTRTDPCQTLAKAYAATIAGGEIVCLDPGIPAVLSTITKSITINCSTVIANLDGMDVAINTAAADSVVLKGLDLELSGVFSAPTSSGLIRFIGAGTLQVENTRINGAKGSLFSGIYFAPTGPAKLIVADSSFTNIGSAGTAAGIYIKPASGVTANVAVERSRIEANYFGIIADGSAGGIIRGLVSDSFVTNNINNGITVSSSSSSVVLTADNTKVTGNNYGLVAGGGANAGMLVSRSVINSNATGLFTTNGAAIYSYRDNRVNGNTTTDGTFTGAVNLQ